MSLFINKLCDDRHCLLPREKLFFRPLGRNYNHPVYFPAQGGLALSVKTFEKKLFHVPFDIAGEEVLDRAQPLTQHMRARRVSDGEEVVLVGPSERPMRCKLHWEPRGSLRLVFLGEEISAPRPPNIVLAMAWPRPQTLAEVLPILGNLGLREVVLLPAERSQGQWSKPSPERNARAQRLLQSGAEVAGHLGSPTLNTPTYFNEWHMDDNRTWLLLEEDGEPIEAVDGPVGLIVGPEGGWGTHEKHRFKEGGAKPVTLGPFNLLVETAVFLSLGIQFLHKVSHEGHG